MSGTNGHATEEGFAICDVDFDRAVLRLLKAEDPQCQPSLHTHSPEGFTAFVESCTGGLAHFHPREAIVPHRPHLARELGFGDWLLPDHVTWCRGAALLMIADRCRAAGGDPVNLRNWWRPQTLNARVGGSERSDHITASAIDLDYTSVRARDAAMREVIVPLYKARLFGVSVGLGRRTTHIGLGTRPRHWTYGKTPWSY